MGSMGSMGFLLEIDKRGRSPLLCEEESLKSAEYIHPSIPPGQVGRSAGPSRSRRPVCHID